MRGFSECCLLHIAIYLFSERKSGLIRWRTAGFNVVTMSCTEVDSDREEKLSAFSILCVDVAHKQPHPEFRLCEG